MRTQIFDRKNETLLETNEEKDVYEFFKNNNKAKVIKQHIYFKENATIDSCFNTKIGGKDEIETLYIYLDI